MIMIINNDIYIVNVGDSRAVMSQGQGEYFEPLTIDHKPMEPGEYKRITE